MGSVVQPVDALASVDQSRIRQVPVGIKDKSIVPHPADQPFDKPRVADSTCQSYQLDATVREVGGDNTSSPSPDPTGRPLPGGTGGEVAVQPRQTPTSAEPWYENDQLTLRLVPSDLWPLS